MPRSPAICFGETIFPLEMHLTAGGIPGVSRDNVKAGLRTLQQSGTVPQ